MMTPAQIRALKELLPIIVLSLIVLGLLGGGIYYINVLDNEEPTIVNVQITQNITIEHLERTPIDFDYDFDIDLDLDYDIEISNEGGFIPPGHRR